MLSRQKPGPVRTLLPEYPGNIRQWRKEGSLSVHGLKDDDGKDGDDCRNNNDGGNIAGFAHVKSPLLFKTGKVLPCGIAGEKVMELGVVQVFGGRVKFPVLPVDERDLAMVVFRTVSYGLKGNECAADCGIQQLSLRTQFRFCIFSYGGRIVRISPATH